MNRKVAIVNAETEVLLAVDEINLSGLNYDPVDQEWFDIAWRNAVEDGLVEDGDRDNYLLSFVD